MSHVVVVSALGILLHLFLPFWGDKFLVLELTIFLHEWWIIIVNFLKQSGGEDEKEPEPEPEREYTPAGRALKEKL